MRRSEAVFKKLNIVVTPVACDFQAEGPSRPETQCQVNCPTQERFELLALYMHERIGLAVYRLRS